MDHTAIIKKIRQELKFLIENSEILGILLYGSFGNQMAHIQSDIDLCLVGSKNPKEVYKKIAKRVDIHGNHYDIQFFERMPWFLKGKVLDHGIPISTQDEPALFEYLYPYRKIWQDQKQRQKLSKQELKLLLKG